MPIYEYVCKQCRHRFERIQKFSDAPVESCPQCGGTVERVLSAPAVQFKGSGWYVTDYARPRTSGSSEGEGDKRKAGDTEGQKKPEGEKKSAEKSDAPKPSTPTKSDKD